MRADSPANVRAMQSHGRRYWIKTRRIAQPTPQRRGQSEGLQFGLTRIRPIRAQIWHLGQALTGDRRADPRLPSLAFAMTNVERLRQSRISCILPPAATKPPFRPWLRNVCIRSDLDIRTRSCSNMVKYWRRTPKPFSLHHK